MEPPGRGRATARGAPAPRRVSRLVICLAASRCACWVTITITLSRHPPSRRSSSPIFLSFEAASLCKSTTALESRSFSRSSGLPTRAPARRRALQSALLFTRQLHLQRVCLHLQSSYSSFMARMSATVAGCRSAPESGAGADVFIGLALKLATAQSSRR